MDALVETLLAHDEWANRTLLEAAAALPAEEWGRERRPGLGSLGRTLGHLVEVADFFADAFAGRAYRMRNDFRSGALGADALLGELARAHPELRRAVRNALAAGGPAGTIELPHGTGRHVAVHVALAQFADHGGHHRAQVQHLLREAGHPAVPEVHPLRFAGLDA